MGRRRTATLWDHLGSSPLTCTRHAAAAAGVGGDAGWGCCTARHPGSPAASERWSRWRQRWRPVRRWSARRWLAGRGRQERAGAAVRLRSTGIDIAQLNATGSVSSGSVAVWLPRPAPAGPSRLGPRSVLSLCPMEVLASALEDRPPQRGVKRRGEAARRRRPKGRQSVGQLAPSWHQGVRPTRLRWYSTRDFLSI